MDAVEWARLEADIFGDRGPGSAGRLADVEREIARTLGALEGLYGTRRRLLAERESRRPAADVCSRLEADCPWISVTKNGSDGLRGTNRGYVVRVIHAPFFVFNEEGKALCSTLPANDMSLLVDSGGVADFRMSESCWTAVDALVGDAPGVNSSRFWGHPHCSEVAEGLEPLSCDVSDLCFGGGRRRDLASRASTQAELVLAVRGLYAWLTELNVDSMYHTCVSGVGLSSDALDDASNACSDARERLRELVRGADYSDFVNRARSGDFSAAPKMVAASAAALSSAPLGRTRLAAEAESVRRAHEDMPNSWWPAIAMHQLVGAALILGAGLRGRGGGCLIDVASGIAACAKEAWTPIGAWRALSSDRISRGPLVGKLLADWEVMKSGQYR